MRGFILAGVAVAGFYAYRYFSKPHCPRHIVAIGDSITASNYLNEMSDYLPGCTFESFGFPGKGSKYIKSKVAEALDNNPDDLVVLAGVNDIASGRSIQSIKDNLLDVYQMAESKGVRVVAVTVLPWHGSGPATDEVNRFIRSRPSGVTVVDAEAMGNQNGLLPGYSNDNLHLTKSGKKKLAKIISDQAFRK